MESLRVLPVRKDWKDAGKAEREEAKANLTIGRES